MTGIVPHVVCPTCSTRLHVFPAALFESVPDEAQVRLVKELTGLQSDDGARFAVAGADGTVACPVCGARFTLDADDAVRRRDQD